MLGGGGGGGGGGVKFEVQVVLLQLQGPRLSSRTHHHMLKSFSRGVPRLVPGIALRRN